MLSNCAGKDLDSKEIKSVNPKRKQPWIFIGRTDAEAETPILWPPHSKSWFTGKDPDVRKDWRQEEKGATEDKTVGWHHWLNGHEFEQTLGGNDGQGSLVCCSSRGHKKSDMTEWTAAAKPDAEKSGVHCWVNGLNTDGQHSPSNMKKSFPGHFLGFVFQTWESVVNTLWLPLTSVHSTLFHA